MVVVGVMMGKNLFDVFRTEDSAGRKGTVG
jgi:hypothetical protein